MLYCTMHEMVCGLEYTATAKFIQNSVNGVSQLNLAF